VYTLDFLLPILFLHERQSQTLVFAICAMVLFYKMRLARGFAERSQLLIEIREIQACGLFDYFPITQGI
jgi:hypothetical protein